MTNITALHRAVGDFKELKTTDRVKYIHDQIVIDVDSRTISYQGVVREKIEHYEARAKIGKIIRKYLRIQEHEWNSAHQSEFDMDMVRAKSTPNLI